MSDSERKIENFQIISRSWFRFLKMSAVFRLAGGSKTQPVHPTTVANVQTTTRRVAADKTNFSGRAAAADDKENATRAKFVCFNLIVLISVKICVMYTHVKYLMQ